jgi:hypothetical protein
MDLSLLNTLREKLVRDKNLSQIYTYFLDHFGEDREFMSLGEGVREPFLEQVLAQIGAQLWNTEVVLFGLILKEVPEYKFIHGAGQMNGHLTTVIYFEEIKSGLCVVSSSRTQPETKFARFRAERVKPVPKPSDN